MAVELLVPVFQPVEVEQLCLIQPPLVRKYLRNSFATDSFNI